MTENGNAPPGGYQFLDRKIENVERDLRSDFSEFRSEIRTDNSAMRSEIRDLGTKIFERIGSSSKPTNPYNLIFTAIGIITLLGSAGSYIAANLSAGISASDLAIKEEVRSRVEATRLLYDKEWSKDAHVEYERRIDERNQLEQTYARDALAQLTHNIETLVAHIVPREEHEQRWKDQEQQLTSLERTLSASLDRVTQHMNKSDELSAAKFNDVEKVIHGYGIADEVKDLQIQLHDALDKIFRIASPTGEAWRPKPPN